MPCEKRWGLLFIYEPVIYTDSILLTVFCSDPQSPAKDKRRKFLQGSRSSYDFYQTTAGDGSDIRDQSSNSVRADQGQSESCANEVLSTARGAEQQLTAEIDRELNAIIKITLGRAKGTSASSRWDILVSYLVKIFLSFYQPQAESNFGVGSSFFFFRELLLFSDAILV